MPTPVDPTATVHPYFTAKARDVLARAGGDPTRSEALAAWAQQAREAADSRIGVIVAETGEILAETRRTTGRVAAAYVRAVTNATDRDLVGLVADLATGALARRHGPAIHVRYSQVCQGAGEGR
jgi:acyl-CoA reductase-like NAD-dependent aldehyde dehydrogenase